MLGPVMPVVLRESVDSGFFMFRRSRQLDPEAYVHYTDCTLANMLIDRITHVTRDLIDTVDDADRRLWWKISANRRATETYIDPYMAVRIKRSKQNRSGRTTSVNTARQIEIKSPFCGAQMSLPYWGLSVVMDDADRLWLTTTFDLDELSEELTEVMIGVERKTGFLWQESLPEADEQVLASLPLPVADRVRELRAIRSA